MGRSGSVHLSVDRATCRGSRTAAARGGLLLALWAALSGGSLSSLEAQVVRGRVMEADAVRPVSGAEIVLVAADRTVVARAVADSTGLFEVEAPRAGTYALALQRLGYRGYESSALDLGMGETVFVELRMAPDAVPLEPMVVTGRRLPRDRATVEFERRRAEPANAGWFLTEAEIEARPLATPTQLLIGAPMVTLSEVIGAGNFGFDTRVVTFANPRAMGGERCMAHVFIDGVYFRQSPTSTLDDLLPPEIVIGVEVYNRPEIVPVEYRRDGDCGAVLFWTDSGEGSDRGWGWKRITAGVVTLVTLLVLGARGT